MRGDPRPLLEALGAASGADLARALQTSRPFRDRHGLFLAEGVRNLVQATDNGWHVAATISCDTLMPSGIARSRTRELSARGVPTLPVSPEEFRSISSAPRASGVALVLRQELGCLHGTKPRDGLCWLVVDGVRSPGNLGTLLRTSVAVGGGGLILIGGEVDPFATAVVRASMGALFRQKLVRTSVAGLSSWARRHRLEVVGATPEAGETHFRHHFRRPALLALGHERSGLSPELRDACTALVRIPMCADLDSLNLSVAGSLLMYEVLRSAPTHRGRGTRHVRRASALPTSNHDGAPRRRVR